METELKLEERNSAAAKQAEECERLTQQLEVLQLEVDKRREEAVATAAINGHIRDEAKAQAERLAAAEAQLAAAGAQAIAKDNVASAATAEAQQATMRNVIDQQALEKIRQELVASQCDLAASQRDLAASQREVVELREANAAHKLDSDVTIAQLKAAADAAGLQVQKLQLEVEAGKLELISAHASESALSKALALQATEHVMTQQKRSLRLVSSLDRRSALMAKIPPPPRRIAKQEEDRAKQASDFLRDCGMRANKEEDFALAMDSFELAYLMSPRVAHALSLANMYLKLDEVEVASGIYRCAIDGCLRSGEHTLAAATDAQLEMARRKLNDATALLQAKLPPAEGAATEDNGGSQGPEVTQAEGGNFSPRELQEELLRAQKQIGELRAQLICERAARQADAPSLEKVEVQMEYLLEEARRARAATAEVLAEKARLGKELLQQQRLHKRARKADRLMLKEQATYLEVQLATRGDEATETATEDCGDAVGADIQRVLHEQGERIMTLMNEGNELRAQLAAARAGALDRRDVDDVLQPGSVSQHTDTSVVP